MSIQQLYRVRWQYHVPAAPADRHLLRELCLHELAFETFFFALYKEYLAQEHGTDYQVAREFAWQRRALIG